jgi:hypothetical protein
MENGNQENTATKLLFAKVDEEIDLLQQLIAFIPPDKLQWRPTENSFRLCDLLGHLLEALAGFCATLHAIYPEALADFLKLRDLPVNHCCEIEEAKERIEQYRASISRGFALLKDRELSKIIPTVFAKNGEPVMTILLGNFEHLLNHKAQLFFYLKLLGVNLSSKDFYRFRGDSPELQ